MKKISTIILTIIFILIYVNNIIAGDIPEGILQNDNALLFFGEVVSYDEANELITVIPRGKIKGDVELDKEKTYYNFSPDDVTRFNMDGELYLMAKYDDINPIYVLSIDSTDTKTLRIKVGGMFERMQEYLNEGKYEEEEKNRLERVRLAKENIEKSQEKQSDLIEEKPIVSYRQNSMIIYFCIVIFILISVVIIIRIYFKDR